MVGIGRQIPSHRGDDLFLRARTAGVDVLFDQVVHLRRIEAATHGHFLNAGNALWKGDRLGRALGMDLNGASA